MTARQSMRLLQRGACGLLVFVFTASTLFAQEPPPRPPAEGSQPVAPATADDPLASPLRQRDLPPSAMAGLLSFFTQGGSSADCWVSPGETADCEVVIPGGVAWHFSGFDPDSEVDVVVQRADGSRVARRVPLEPSTYNPAYSFGEWEWAVLPGDPAGIYTITATGRARQVSRQLVVNPPLARPRSYVYPSQAPAGSTFTIALTGFAPNQLVDLDLFRSSDCRAPGGTFLFASRLKQLRVNARGEAVDALRTFAQDPACRYAIETQPPSARMDFNEFAVTGTVVDESLDPWAAVVEEANRVWAATTARNGAPLDSLGRVYGEPLLGQVTREIVAMRAAGQYRETRQTGPTLIRRAELLAGDLPLPPTNGATPGFVHEVLASEQWDDRLFGPDGAALEVNTTRELWRYLIGEVTRQEGNVVRWLIVRAEYVRSD